MWCVWREGGMSAHVISWILWQWSPDHCWLPGSDWGWLLPWIYGSATTWCFFVLCGGHPLITTGNLVVIGRGHVARDGDDHLVWNQWSLSLDAKRCLQNCVCSKVLVIFRQENRWRCGWNSNTSLASTPLSCGSMLWASIWRTECWEVLRCSSFLLLYLRTKQIITL